MRSALQVRRRGGKGAVRVRHRYKQRRLSDIPESDDDDEEIVVIGGGPADDKPSNA
jgi:hypothetical protein